MITAIKRFSSKVNTIIDLLLLKVVTVIKKMFGNKPAAGGAAPGKGKEKGKGKGGKEKGKGGKGKKSYKGKGGKKKKGDKGKGKKKKKGDKGKAKNENAWMNNKVISKNELGDTHTLSLEGTAPKPYLMPASSQEKLLSKK